MLKSRLIFDRVSASALAFCGFLFAAPLPAICQTATGEGDPVSLSSPTMRPLVPSDLSELDAGMQTITPGTADFESEPAVEAASADETGTAQEKIKQWRIIPMGGFVALADDNIFISDTNRVSDVILMPSIGLAFELGDFRNLREDYLIAKYVGTGLIYLQNPKENAYNQLALLDGQLRVANLAIQLTSQYQYLSTPDRDVGGLVKRSIFDTALGFVYSYSDKTSMDLEFRQKSNIYVDDLDSFDYAVKGGAEYLITEKLALGGELVAGALDAEGSPLQYYQQLRFRAQYSATGKLTFKFSGGVETRELDDLSSVRVNPVFSLGGEYQPFENTLVAFTAYRRVQASALDQGSDFTATGFEISVEQTLFQKIEAAVAVGYENDAYFSTDGGNDGRVDNYIFARPSLSVTFLTNYQASIFYEYRNNASNQSSSSFYNNRFGIAVEAQF